MINPLDIMMQRHFSHYHCAHLICFRGECLLHNTELLFYPLLAVLKSRFLVFNFWEAENEGGFHSDRFDSSTATIFKLILAGVEPTFSYSENLPMRSTVIFTVPKPECLSGEIILESYITDNNLETTITTFRAAVRFALGNLL